MDLCSFYDTHISFDSLVNTKNVYGIMKSMSEDREEPIWWWNGHSNVFAYYFYR